MLAMRKRIPDEVVPVLLPVAGAWSSPADVESYARACMEICGLIGWEVVWDRAVRRLGCCKMSRRQISFSRYYVEAYLQRSCEAIRRTVLHEIAHALAWERYAERGHGAAWHYCCAVLGIPDEKAACKCEDFTPAHLRKRPQFALCNSKTGEIYRYYVRAPKISARKLSQCYIPGMKEATLGLLCIVSLPNLTRI